MTKKAATTPVQERQTASVGARGRITLQGVAEKAGVSISTASRVLSGASGISGAVRDRVLTAAKELNYATSSSAARNVTILSDIDTISIGADDFIHGVMDGVNAECQNLGIVPKFQLISSATKKSLQDGSKVHNTDGFILLSIFDESLVEALVNANVPTIVLNGVDSLMRVDAVAPANRSGGLLATNHLIDLGHTRILNFTYESRPTIQDRLAGYTTAMTSANLPIEDDFIVPLKSMRTDTGYARMKALLEKRKRKDFTAVVCCNDAVAIGVSTAIAEAGLQVPEDISVVGFDDIATASMSSPPLTTIFVDRLALGAFGIQRLAERVRTPQIIPTYTEFAVTIIVRESTGPARKSTN